LRFVITAKLHRNDSGFRTRTTPAPPNVDPIQLCTRTHWHLRDPVLLSSLTISSIVSFELTRICKHHLSYAAPRVRSYSHLKLTNSRSSPKSALRLQAVTTVMILCMWVCVYTVYRYQSSEQKQKHVCTYVVDVDRQKTAEVGVERVGRRGMQP
jgi:hypothetical protein